MDPSSLINPLRKSPPIGKKASPSIVVLDLITPKIDWYPFIFIILPILVKGISRYHLKSAGKVKNLKNKNCN